MKKKGDRQEKCDQYANLIEIKWRRIILWVFLIHFFFFFSLLYSDPVADAFFFVFGSFEGLFIFINEKLANKLDFHSFCVFWMGDLKDLLWKWSFMAQHNIKHWSYLMMTKVLCRMGAISFYLIYYFQLGIKKKLFSLLLVLTMFCGYGSYLRSN